MLEHGVHAALVGGKGVQPLAAHPDFSGGRFFESGDQTKKSGLAGAAFTEQREEFSLSNVQ